MSSRRGPAMAFILVTLLIDVIGFGIIIPVMPRLITELTGATTSEAARLGGWIGGSYAAMQFVFAPVVGALSDRYGRRPVLLASLFGFGLDYIVMALAPTIWWLFASRLVAGVLGASFTTGAAYIADISPPEKRAQNFGLVGAAFGVGFILGPMIGGILGQYGLRVPFIGAAILTLVNWLYGFFVLPESLPLDRRRKFEWKRANPISALTNLRRYPVIAGLIISLMLVNLAAHSVQSNWSYYTIEKFNWDPAMIGRSLAVIGLAAAVVQAGLVRVIIPALGRERSVYVGLGMYAMGYLLYAVATKTWMMMAFTLVYCLGGIAGPALQGIISTQVAPNEQGELQGALTSLMSATAILGPPLMNNTFAFFTQKNGPIYLPGAALLLGGFLTIVSALLARRSLKRHALRSEPAAAAS